MSVYHTEKSSIRQIEQGVFLIYKERGETLAVLIERFRLEQGVDSGIPVTYAGRLDPMAEGVVILLVGEACKRKEAFLGFDKEYECQVLFGVSTDTFDMLGIVDSFQPKTVSKDAFLEALHSIQGEIMLPYPPYSSKPVDGIPLFHRARTGSLPSTLPQKKGYIYTAQLIEMKDVSLRDYISTALQDIGFVKGDFRQDEIIKKWNEYQSDDTVVSVATIRLVVSSGVYVRSIATHIGSLLGVLALAYSIKRISLQKNSPV